MTVSKTLFFFAFFLLFCWVITNQHIEQVIDGGLNISTGGDPQDYTDYEPGIEKDNIKTIHKILRIYPGVVRWRFCFIVSFFASILLGIIGNKLNDICFIVCSFLIVFTATFFLQSFISFHIYGKIWAMIEKQINFIDENYFS